MIEIKLTHDKDFQKMDAIAELMFDLAKQNRKLEGRAWFLQNLYNESLEKLEERYG